MQLQERFYNLRNTIRQQLFSHLNEEQFKAVATGAGPVLCLAGAGSGKTMAMVNRILHLYIFGPKYNPRPDLPASLTQSEIELMEDWLKKNEETGTKTLPPQILRLINMEGIQPRSILAITFTNKAAEEMKARLEALLGETAREMWVMTFHKACVRILRREITALGYSSDFTIYDDYDHLQVIKKAIVSFNLDDKKFNPRAISSLISRYKCELKEPVDIQKKPLDYWQEKGVQVYDFYQKELKKNNALDFDDLITLTVKLFSDNRDILDKYQKRFQYIMVDEYQDTNHAQYQLVNLLAEKHNNLFVVGDDDQSIYSFRQADIRNILEFERDFSRATLIKLECNYRSTQRILTAANEVIKNNTGRKDKALWTQNPEGELLTQYRAEDEKDEARFISEKIFELLDKGSRFQDCAVLIRTNAQSRALEERFMKTGIPYRIFGGQKFYERMEIKDIMAYLKLLVNPSDSVSLRRIINVPRRGIGEATIQKIESFSIEHELNLYEAVDKYTQIDKSTKALKGAAGFVRFMENMKEEVAAISITALTEKILTETGYIEGLEKDNSVESQSRLENLKEFLTVTNDYDEKTSEPSLSDFLSQVCLVSDLDSYEDEQNTVTIMTMHMAKGLEFSNIFIGGLEEGIFPHSRSLMDDELEEERRLCYVALTRAKERIYLIYAKQRNLFGRRSYNLPSRFLEEIPLGLWEEYKRVSTFFETSYEGNSTNSQYGALNLDFILGDKVEHKKWGQGVIVGTSGQGEDIELQVAFPGMGIKTVLARYAPLQKVQ
jgi:DNA helicase-2/ATP-dependent DNA helicase PcrA